MHPDRLKLLSYNVQVGIPSRKFHHYVTNSWKHVLPFSERKANLDRIADFISDFDIVGLQELDSGSIRSEFMNQPEYLAEKAGFPFVYSRVNRDLGLLGQHSLALYSRIEALTVRDHVLPSRIPGRGALEAHFDIGADEPLVVILAHLSLMPKARRRQLSYVSDVISEYRHVVFMGDFNTTTHSPEMGMLFDSSRLAAPLHPVFTFPSWNPRVALDHILITPELKLGEPQSFGLGHSDHLPVALDVICPRARPARTTSARVAAH